MLKRITLPLGALLALACALPALAADPSPAQVYQAARSGNLAGAQQMIAQVLKAHPQSGQAHYAAAEIDARAGTFGLARQELHTAESLEPGLPFANPRSVRELQMQLGGAPGAAGSRPPVRARNSSHVGLFLILIAAAIVLWMVLRRRAAAMGYRQYPGQYPGGPPPGAPPAGYGPGGYPGGYMPGGGSGIMGSVASGLALGAGVAGGEELVQHMMGGGSGPGGGGVVPPAQAGPLPDANADLGGNDFGLNDPGSWDDGGGGDGGDGGGWT
ncbi:MAG: tetratricopeptide repeat protein [Steroidobacteraceae bacterium]